MKVIKHGTPKEELMVLRFTCGRCGCVFDAEKGEFRELQGEGKYRCRCPECGAEASEYREKTGNKVLYKTGIGRDCIRSGQCPHCGADVNDFNDSTRCRKCGGELLW